MSHAAAPARRHLPVLTTHTEQKWSLYAQRCFAALDRLQPGATLAGPSAAALLNAPLPAVPRGVYVRNIPRGRYGAHLVVLPPGPALDFDGVLVSDPARVAADCVRMLPPRDALIVADALLAGGWCSTQDLAQVAADLCGTTKVQRVRWLAAHADPRAESPGETWSRLVLANLGYEVVSQHHVQLHQREAWLDLLIAGTFIAVEFDGKDKYERYGAHKIVAEKLRDGDLEEIGYRLLHVVWSQLHNPGQLDRRLRCAGGRPARRPVPLPW